MLKSLLLFILCCVILCSCGVDPTDETSGTIKATISWDSNGPIFSRYYTIEEFDYLEIGESTVDDIARFHPEGYFAIQYAAGQELYTHWKKPFA